MRADLSGKVAIVTGGSKGIGRGIAVKLAENGSRVAIVARGAAEAGRVVDEIRSKGGEAVHEPADIGKYPEVAAMVQRVLERWDKVDVLVASGGYAYPIKPFLETPPDNMVQYFDRFFNRVYCTRAVVDSMVQQKFGKIIFITTDAGRWPTYSETLNGSAAAGLIYFTRCLGMELARHGVRVNSISTTLTKDTPGWEAYLKKMEEDPNDAIGRVFRKIEEKVPFGLNKPEDLANLALFLASNESNQISGATISINGGISFPG